MQYQSGTMRQLGQTPSQQHTPQRHINTNSVHGNTNNYEGYHYESNKIPQSFQNTANNNVRWDRDNDFFYNQRAKYDKDRDIKTQDYRELDKSRERSQISYHQKKQQYYQGSNVNRNNSGNQLANQISKVVPFTIHSSGRDARNAYLRIQLFKTQKVGSSSSASINIHITDDNDSKFLWSFYIPESEFPTLKQQLALKVQFDGFNKMIKDHLDLCQKFQSSDKNSDTPQTNFYAILNINKSNQQSQFKIIQANKYKQVQQLKLQFRRANDQQLIKYLSQKYDSEKSESTKQSQIISGLQNQLNNRKLASQQLHTNFQLHKIQSQQTIHSLQLKQKQKLETLQRRIEDRYLKQRQEQLEQHNTIVQELKDKLQVQTNKYNQLLASLQTNNQKTITLESTSTNLQNQYNLLQIEYAALKDNYGKLQDNYKKLNVQHNQVGKNYAKSQYVVGTLMEKNQQKNRQLGEIKKSKEQMQQQIVYLQTQIKQQTAQISEHKKNNIKNEEKSQALIQQLQDTKKKLQKKKKKNTQYVRIIQKQQQNVLDTQAKVTKHQMEIKRLVETTDRLENGVIKDKQKKIKDLQRQLEDGKCLIEQQKKIIMQMHKQTNARYGTGMSTGLIGMGNTGSSNYQMGSTSSTVRDYTTYGSESRIRYAGGGGTVRQTSPLTQKSDIDRMVPPPIKKYREPTGAQNQRNRENSKSPIVKKLSQQLDPQENDKTKQKIGPIKFKK